MRKLLSIILMQFSGRLIIRYFAMSSVFQPTTGFSIPKLIYWSLAITKFEWSFFLIFFKTSKIWGWMEKITNKIPCNVRYHCNHPRCHFDTSLSQFSSRTLSVDRTMECTLKLNLYHSVVLLPKNLRSKKQKSNEIRADSGKFAKINLVKIELCSTCQFSCLSRISLP